MEELMVVLGLLVTLLACGGRWDGKRPFSDPGALRRTLGC